MTESTSRTPAPRSARPNAAEPTAEALARAHRGDALARGEAVVIGNRAGVVEWTTPAWAHLTGFPLAETIDKPITHFLDHAGLEVELVDFVAQHFLEGRRCTVALPFDTLDGRRLDLELDVEPLREPSGEIGRFVAVVREAAPVAEPTPSVPTQPRRPARRSRDRRRHALAIAPLAAGALARVRQRDPARFDAIVDAALDEAFVPVSSRAPGAPGRAIASARLAHLVESLVEASLASEATGPRHLTLLSGRLRPGRSHHSQAHAIPQRAVVGYDTPHTFLEVHDTSPHLDREALERIRRAVPGPDPRERAWVAALTMAERLGARLFVDSTPGCGNQALVVFEAPADERPQG